MKAKWLLALLISCAGLAATELPIYARWQARHFGYYDTLQSGKELSWDQLYQAEIGIEGHKWENWEFGFALQSEEFFDEAIVRLKSFDLEYKLPDTRFSLGAGTGLQGYGGQSALDSLPVLEKGYNPYRFQMMRMNALTMAFESSPASRWELKAGGNKHNQASLLLSFKRHAEGGYYLFSCDARAMDNHWRTPVAIPALEYYESWNQISWGLSSALAVLPKWDATVQHNDFFALGELRYSSKILPEIGVAAAYQKQNYSPFEEQEYRLYLAHDAGHFRFTPIATLQEIDHERLWKYSFLSQYKLLNSSTIGAYYEYSYFGKNKPRHTMGLAIDLEYKPVK